MGQMGLGTATSHNLAWINAYSRAYNYNYYVVSQNATIRLHANPTRSFLRLNLMTPSTLQSS
jgi:hypothetical protein